MAGSMFDRYGGFGQVSRIVSALYGRVFDRPGLASYFVGVDMRRLIDHQTKFVASLMGGPASYTNEHLQRVHNHLHISDQAFDEMAMLVREVLEDHGFDETDIATVYSNFVARRAFIVTESAPTVAADHP